MDAAGGAAGGGGGSTARARQQLDLAAPFTRRASPPHGIALQPLIAAAACAKQLTDPVRAAFRAPPLATPDCDAQGDREADVGLPVSAMCNRTTMNMPRAQLGFIRIFLQVRDVAWRGGTGRCWGVGVGGGEPVGVARVVVGCEGGGVGLVMW